MAELGIRNVRNFWLTAQADGGSPVTLGPKSKDGGLKATLLLRERGGVSDDKIVIAGYTIGDKNYVRITFPPGAAVRGNMDGSAEVLIEKER